MSCFLLNIFDLSNKAYHNVSRDLYSVLSLNEKILQYVMHAIAYDAFNNILEQDCSLQIKQYLRRLKLF